MLIRQLIELLVCFFIFVYNIRAEMDGYIVGGEKVAIEKYPHSAFLDVWCSTHEGLGWTCGSSILNQHFMLTAAHCLAECTRSGYILVTVGHKHKYRGAHSSAYRIKTHKKYHPETFVADIGLVRLKTPFKLGPKIQRVILMRNPPHDKVAYVAGWGVVDEETRNETNWLKHVKQVLWPIKKCRNLLGNIPEGSICAGTKNGNDYAAVGDSGSALVIQPHIQIGIVSFKAPHITASLLVYVNVTHYYVWIINSTAAMFCAE